MSTTDTPASNPTFKAVGISLAVGSGYITPPVAQLSIVCLSAHLSYCNSVQAFSILTLIRKKKGLLAANKQYETNPGEGILALFNGHSNRTGFKYLKNVTWWAGMS